MDIQHVCPSCGIRVVPNSDGACPSCRTQLGIVSDSAPRLFVGDAGFSIPWYIPFWFSFRPRIKGEGTYEISDEGILFRGAERDPRIRWPAFAFVLLTCACYYYLVTYAKVPLIREHPMHAFFVMYCMAFTARVLGQRDRPLVVPAFWLFVEQIRLPKGPLGKHVVVFMQGQRRVDAIYFIPEIDRDDFVAALPIEAQRLVFRE